MLFNTNYRYDKHNFNLKDFVLAFIHEIHFFLNQENMLKIAAMTCVYLWQHLALICVDLEAHVKRMCFNLYNTQCKI